MTDTRPQCVEIAEALGLACDAFATAREAQAFLETRGVPTLRARAVTASLQAKGTVKFAVEGFEGVAVYERRRFHILSKSVPTAKDVAPSTEEQLGERMALHELANALTVVLGLASTEAPARDTVMLIARAAEDGLRVARWMEHGQGTAQPGDGASAVRRAVDGLRAMASGKDVTLALEEPSRRGEVADEHGLAAIAWNLIKNAVEASPDGSTVRVAVRVQARSFELRVQDQGPGLKAGGSKKPGGRGVGLRIVRELVRRLDGELRLEDAAGGGTLALVTTPAQVVSELPPAPRTNSKSSGVRTLAPRVAVIEDDAALRELVADRLEQVGCVVRRAGSVSEALALKGPFDVALVDANLGSDTPASRVVESLRPFTRFVVAMTGDPRSDLQVDHLIRKPFDLSEVVELVDELAERANRERAVG